MTDKAKNILVVDDEEIIRNVCRRSLEKRGYDIDTAEHGMQALDLLGRKEYSVVFSDLKMPVMHGMELLDAIKRDYSHVEVIIMTAFATLESAVQAMKKGAHDFLLKPVKPAQVRIVADRCFEKIKLGEENEALRLANKKLSDLKEMKDKFIAITSHELRTPVSHLKGYFGILTDDYYDHLTPEERKHCVEVLSKAVEQLEEIVSRMHGLSHLEKGTWEPQTKLLDLNQLIQEIYQDHELILRQRNLTMTLRKWEEPVLVRSDPAQVKSMLNELVQNAVKFTPDGGKITIVSEVEDEFCVVSVKDTGIGVELDEQGKIFEKFYEVQNSAYHSSSKEEFMGGGLGIGLSSAQAIARSMGGGIKVQSGLGEGAEFLVYLPLDKQYETSASTS